MTEFVFETPSPEPRSSWNERLSELRQEHPGEWINATQTYGMSPRSMQSATIKAAAIRVGLAVEVTTRNQGKPDCAIYIRVLKEDA